MIYTVNVSSPVGQLFLSQQDEALIGLWIEGQKYAPSTLLPGVHSQWTPLLRQTEDWLRRYFSGEKPDPALLPLAPQGSEFQKQVWKLLLEIPYGQTITYGFLSARVAEILGKPRMSAQAVGGAVGHNPISIIIPCHRVVGADGSLTGYAGGIEKKIALLTHEAADMSRLFVPKKGTAI